MDPLGDAMVGQHRLCVGFMGSPSPWAAPSLHQRSVYCCGPSRPEHVDEDGSGNITKTAPGCLRAAIAHMRGGWDGRHRQTRPDHAWVAPGPSLVIVVLG